MKTEQELYDEYKRYLLTENRLACWNHVRYRAGAGDLTLEQAATAMARNPQLASDLKDYLDDDK
jgi:hypothetical protein